MSKNTIEDLSNENNIFSVTLKKGFLKNTFYYHTKQQNSIARSKKRKSIIKERYKTRYDERIKDELKSNTNIEEAKNKVKTTMKKEKEKYDQIINFKRNHEFLGSMCKDLFEVWKKYNESNYHLSCTEKLQVKFNYFDVVLSLDYYIKHYQKSYDSSNTIRILHTKMEHMTIS